MSHVVIVKHRTRHEHSGVYQAKTGNVCSKARKNPRSCKNHAWCKFHFHIVTDVNKVGLIQHIVDS